MHNVTTVMTEDDENIENTEPGCQYREEINRGQTVGMVFQKRSPCLRRWFSSMHHILRDRSLRDFNTKFEQFPVDSRRASANICRLHLSNELAYFGIDRRSARTLAPAFPVPVASKTFAMPTYNGVGVQCVQHRLPSINIH